MAGVEISSPALHLCLLGGVIVNADGAWSQLCLVWTLPLPDGDSSGKSKACATEVDSRRIKDCTIIFIKPNTFINQIKIVR